MLVMHFANGPTSSGFQAKVWSDTNHEITKPGQTKNAQENTESPESIIITTESVTTERSLLALSTSSKQQTTTVTMPPEMPKMNKVVNIIFPTTLPRTTPEPFSVGTIAAITLPANGRYSQI